MKIEISPTFGVNDSDVSRVRNGRVNWLDMDMTPEFIFALEIPFEVAGIAVPSSDTDDPLRAPVPSSVDVVRRGEVDVRGITPDSSVRDGLLPDGMKMEMGVDSLSRSVILTDVDERDFVDILRKQTDIGAESLDALKRALLVPTYYDELGTSAAIHAQQLLTENIRRHEREHVDCLINPETALWREVELYWRSVLLGANPRTWQDSGFLNRFARLYTIPSHFMTELLAMMKEDYTAAGPAIQHIVETDVASQRGVASSLMRFIEEHNISSEALQETLRSPLGEQVCDLWLAYVIDEIRAERSLSEIDATQFREQYLSRLDFYNNIVSDPETRSLLTNFMRDRCFGPVVEMVRLNLIDGRFVLERGWYSLNPDVSEAGNRLAVRRALFRRQFLSLFGSESGLNDARDALGTAIERVIRGASLDDVGLSEFTLPSLDHLAESVSVAHEATAAALLGTQATSDDLHNWLNDPEYKTERPPEQ